MQAGTGSTDVQNIGQGKWDQDQPRQSSGRHAGRNNEYRPGIRQADKMAYFQTDANNLPDKSLSLVQEAWAVLRCEG